MISKNFKYKFKNYLRNVCKNLHKINFNKYNKNI